MSATKCAKLMAEGKYSELYDYCISQKKLSPNETIYDFYMAVALIHLLRIEEARQTLQELYSKEGKAIYLVVSAITHLIEGDARKGCAEINEAIKKDDNIEELMFIFELCMEETLIASGQAAIKKALMSDPIKSAEILRTYFEGLASNPDLTADDRLNLLNALSVFDRLAQRIAGYNKVSQQKD
ncbi:MAG: hypothetical protein QXU54_00985 [Candidatus Micrarchaeia archaeon]